MKRIIALLFLVATCFLYLPAFAAEGETVQADPFIEIIGRLMIDGKAPMSGGVVSFFDVTAGPPPNHGNVRRIPDMVSPIRENGTFSAKMLAGKFYLGALSRKPELGPGPPRPGEKLFFAMDSDETTMRGLEIASGMNKDLGDIRVSPSLAFKELQDFFTVEGSVKDETGKPVSDALIIIKIDLASPRPDLIFSEIGKDGRYRIKLSVGKPYHFIVRNTISPGRPSVGSYVGTYNGPQSKITEGPDQEALPAPITGKAGEVVTGIDITVNAVPDPDAIKKQMQAEAAKEQQPIEAKEPKTGDPKEQKVNDKPSP